VRQLVKSLDAECEGKTIQQSAVTSNGLQCGINRNILWLFERHKHSPRPNTITLITVPEHATQTPCSSGYNGGYSLDNFLPMSPPHHRSVSVGCPSIGHTQTAQCLVGTVALSSCTVQIQLKLSVQLLQYDGPTASLWLVQWCLLY
jgi:hypothetical protein